MQIVLQVGPQLMTPNLFSTPLQIIGIGPYENIQLGKFLKKSDLSVGIG